MTWRAPWRDRGGRLSRLRGGAFVAMVLPATWTLGEWATVGLGAQPVTVLIHQSGLWAIRFLLLSLAITPARFVLDWPRVTQLRRMVGVTALAYAMAHLLLYVIDQKWRLGVVASEIVRRHYLTVGFVALLGLAALGASSTDAAIRRMGRRWKVLHRLSYLLAALGVWHFFMQGKADVSQAAIMAGLLVWLLLWRVLPAGWRGGWLGVGVLLLAVPPLAALIEAGWYGAATRVRPMRILAANWNPPALPRPATWVAGAALLVPMVKGLRRAAARRQAGRRP